MVQKGLLFMGTLFVALIFIAPLRLAAPVFFKYQKGLHNMQDELSEKP
jgi:hypothetical protein